MTDTLPLSIQPVISYPKEAEVGKTYLMEIDLQMPESGFEWQYEEEEYLIYCMVNAGNLFTVTSVGEPAIVLHRFGGTYGSVKILLEAALEEKNGTLSVLFVNQWGTNIRTITLTVTIQTKKSIQNSTIVAFIDSLDKQPIRVGSIDNDNQDDKNWNLKNKLKRLEERREVLQLEWNIRIKKLEYLRLYNASESRVLEIIELNREIQKKEASLRTLQRDIDNIETEIEITTQELEEYSIFYEYRDTGALPASALTYVKRKADTELFNSLMKGGFCYVFNSRQMGKSSLRLRVKADLEKKGFICVTILPTVIVASDLTEENWYKGIITIIVEDIGLNRPFDINEWWEKQKGLSGVQKFDNFIRQVLLNEVSQKIIIFIDEIDRILSLSFNLDSFFAAIRECYNKRAENSDYERLTFVLLGVTTPSDLIRDGYSTPFNIGHAIDLTGFTFEEAQPLIAGLSKVADNPSEVLKEIIDWTMGQPYLTQMLCKRIEENEEFISDGEEKIWIERFIQKNIIENIQNQESPDLLAFHFYLINNHIRENLLRRNLLEIYKNIIENGSIKVDNSREQQALRLSGLVVRRSGRLEVYNRIYKEVFDQKWLEKSLTDVIDRRDVLQSEWNLRNEKLKRMRVDLVIEDSTAVKFQLEHQLLEEEFNL